MTNARAPRRICGSISSFDLNRDDLDPSGHPDWSDFPSQQSYQALVTDLKDYLVSDTSAKDASADKSGPLIQSILQEQGFACTARIIVPDEERKIQQYVRFFSDSGDVDWIITTGGTGFGVRDRTPEVSFLSDHGILYSDSMQAISPLIERDAPGLVHLMMSTSLKHTPLAALSRPIAGTIQNKLVVTLPGSPKAVKENLEALLSGGVVNHAIELIRGGSGKQVHASLAAGNPTPAPAVSGHAHEHHHHHDHSHHIPQPRTTLSHDPSLPGEELPCICGTSTNAFRVSVCTSSRLSLRARFV